MAKRRKRALGTIAQIQMAPMIDVVFQLLIFFLVTSQVKPVEADFMANLPAGSGPRDATVDPKEPRRVYLAKDPSDPNHQRVLVSLDGTSLGPAPGAFRELYTRLKMLTDNEKTKKNLLLVIDAEPTMTVQYLAWVLDVTVEAKVPAVTFGRPKGS